MWEFKSIMSGQCKQIRLLSIMVLNWITQNCCVYAHAQCVGVHISDWITHIDSYQQGSGVEKVIVAIHTSLFQFGIQIHRPLLECGASSSKPLLTMDSTHSVP